MRPSTPEFGDGPVFHGNPPEFSLVLGGPLFQLLRRAHLADDALMMVRQRVIVIALLAWLPLLVLSAIEGNLLGGGLSVPFLLDAEVHIRFLVAMPLLIVAELVVHRRMRPLVQQFLERNLIPGNAMTRFDAAIASAFRLRNSVLAEVLLIAFVYGVGILIVWRQYLALDTATWYATPAVEGAKLSLAGIWYGYVSLPIFQFLLVRWYFRLFVWTRFLWQVSRIELSLVPTHPDRVGGLGFLSNTVYAFATLAVAHGALLAGHLANRIFFAGAALTEFKAEIAVVVAFLLCAILGPLLVFTPQLAQAKRKGLREYGALAECYVRGFDAKWLRGGAPADEAFVGSADIQSLADLGNSYELVRTMRLAPITKEAILRVAAAALVPMVPLLLTMMPLEALLKVLLGVVF
jgi:AcrR family transcriptional regulator